MRKSPWTQRLLRHTAIPALLVSLAVPGIMALDVFRQKEEAVVLLETLSGNPSVLSDVVLQGEIADAVHRTSFRVAGGQVENRTTLLRQPKAERAYRYSYGGRKRIGLGDDLEYEVGDVGPYRIVARSMSAPDQTGRSASIPAITRPVKKSDGSESRSFANPLEYGLAGDGDKLYFVEPVTREAGGEATIYEIGKEDLFGQAKDSDGAPIRKRVSWPLVPASVDPAKAVDVLGLEVVRGNLIVILYGREGLTLRCYDAGSGEQTGTVTLPDIRIGGSDESEPSKAPVTTQVQEGYRAYADNRANSLTLGFPRSFEENREGWAEEVLSFTFDSEFRLAHRVTVDDPNTRESRLGYGDATAMSYQNGKLYTIRSLNILHSADQQREDSLALPSSIRINVYQEGKRLYQGALITDLNDDLLELPDPSAYSGGGFSYRVERYRTLMNASFFPRNEEVGP
ncbi:hypothetical protein [Gorillibacterium sp. CAU 1737]|uniref:hypothetical protein n=1 Tax=Gorillibacterium sp. CAU 1737 TaxID=3140362 RepID=UPI003261A1AB